LANRSAREGPGSFGRIRRGETKIRPKEKKMFQHRSRDFDPRVSAIVNHLRGIQDQLGKIGRDAGRRGADSAAAAGNQIAEAIAPILNDIGARFRRGQRAAFEGASGLGDMSSRVGSRAVARLTDQAQQRPLLILAVAIGVGILIGAASRRASLRRP
jgi:ElaB/YqjD/DUF883 family membrane-anchored ribosome-binding protein